MKNLCSYRVIYADTDQMGVVYYANYLRWFERGRAEFLRQMGLPYATIESGACHFPVTEVNCRYRRSARYDELVVIETELVALGRVTLKFSYRILTETNTLLAHGWTQHACVDGSGRIRRMPQDVERKLRAVVAQVQAVRPDRESG